MTDPVPSGAVAGAPRAILRAEGLALGAAALWLYAQAGASWGPFALLILAPDLAMLGYLAGPRAGAAAYNAAHTWLVPLLLLAAGELAALPRATALGLIWAAHVGFDRALGYGLKYPRGFGATHLSAR